MSTQFDRWEKDPFFSAAEEVQESADRMESTYRTWMHAKKEISGLWNIDDLRRDLQTTLGTTKWQLEEFEKAVNSSYKNGLVDDSKDRHRDFIVATDSQVKKVEKSLNQSTVSHGKPPHPWARLDEGELDELALFLSGPSATFLEGKKFGRLLKKDQQAVSLQEVDKKEAAKNLKESSYPHELGRLEAMEYSPGHRRTASASADIGSWKISVSDDSFNPSSSDEQPGLTPRKVPSLSGFLNTLESATTQFKWPKIGYRKLKLLDRGQEADTLPQSKQLTKGLTSCYEGNKSCLDSCDDCYDKPLHGWYGAVQRQLQRSQYHVQYSRPVQIVFSIVLLFCLIVLLAMRAT